MMKKGSRRSKSPRSGRAKKPARKKARRSTTAAGGRSGKGARRSGRSKKTKGRGKASARKRSKAPAIVRTPRIDRKVFVRLLKAGKSDAQIARAVHSTPGGVAKIRRIEFGVVYEKGPSARHSAADVARMQQMYDSGNSCAEVGRAFRTSASTIQKLIRTRSVAEANVGAHLRIPVVAVHESRPGKRRYFDSISEAGRALRIPTKTVENQVKGLTKRSRTGWAFEAAK